jgi:hypothetical protein
VECTYIVQSRSNEGNQATYGGNVYKQTLGSVKLTTGKKGKKTELTGKGPLRRLRSALDCSATEEEEVTVFTVVSLQCKYIVTVFTVVYLQFK